VIRISITIFASTENAICFSFEEVYLLQNPRKIEHRAKRTDELKEKTKTGRECNKNLTYQI
jgi:hypothetical protein